MSRMRTGRWVGVRKGVAIALAALMLPTLAPDTFGLPCPHHEQGAPDDHAPGRTHAGEDAGAEASAGRHATLAPGHGGEVGPGHGGVHGADHSESTGTPSAGHPAASAPDHGPATSLAAAGHASATAALPEDAAHGDHEGGCTCAGRCTFSAAGAPAAIPADLAIARVAVARVVVPRPDARLITPIPFELPLANAPPRG